MTEFSMKGSDITQADEKEIIAVVGAGGKTSWIHQQAKKYIEKGKRVLITTTTHMLVEEGMSLWNMNVSENLQIHTNVSLLQKSIGRLENHEILVAGALCEPSMKNDSTNSLSYHKFTRLPEDILQTLMKHADVVLMEADGSKRMPLKYPAEYEPVLRKDLTRVVVIMGKNGIGKRVEEVLHRWEIADLSSVMPGYEKIISRSMVLHLFEIYEKKIAEACPDVLIERYLAEIIDGEMRYEQY